MRSIRNLEQRSEPRSLPVVFCAAWALSSVANHAIRAREADNEEGVPGELFAENREEWRRDFGRWIFENEAPYFGDALPGCDVSSPLREWTRADMLTTTVQATIEFNRSAAVKRSGRVGRAR